MVDTALNIYLREIMKFKIPTPEEEYELIKEAKKNNRTARDQLIVRHLQTVVKIARLYQTSGVPLGDLIDEGNIGLIRAIKSYNLNKGIRFISYASWWIRHRIHRAIYQQLRIVKVPIQRMSDKKTIREMEQELSQKLFRFPSIEEVAEALNITPHEVDQAMDIVQNDLSLDIQLGDADTALLDFIKGNPERLEDQAIRGLLVGELAEGMEELNDIEKLVIKLRFGLNGEPVRKLREIGEMINLSRERVRQIEEKALDKLRRKVGK
jgi:RNA polymerase primary sigma factor